ncbi:MAG: amidase [Rhodospirillales bacterium]|jgi:aspartyl-tRNA(Asn)/glutamyl-tRNA(Gln) amidotransferase subunit A|nr:amidase [Rhodospirillales bacterium]
MRAPAPHWLTASEASRAFAARTLSPVDLLTDLLARIEALQPKLHAFVRLDADAAMDAARAAERELAARRIRGPLHGIPVAVKDIIDVAGLPTTCHSRLLLDNVAAADAEVIARLRQAGAIILGKTATHEFAIGGPSFDLPFPPARNPWNPDHHPGGSSSGSGAGVAGGLFPAALGSDTGGSVRNPASCCGIVGLKPTYGLVSRRGVFPLSYTLDHVGPLVRSVADAALMLDAMAGHDPADPGSAPSPTRLFARELGRGVRDLRIGFVRHFHETDQPAHPEMTAALEDAARVLQAEGADLRTVTLPRLTEFGGVNRVILTSEAWSVHARWLRTRPGEYGRLSRQRLLPGAFIPAGDYVGAQRRRTQMIAAVEDTLREVDVLLCASSMDPASRIEDAAETARTYPRQARTPFNVTGHPALAMMAGLSRDGLPLSVQFVGRYFHDATVLRVAAAFERATGWNTRRPPIG